jgi:hypothetical protein
MPVAIDCPSQKALAQEARVTAMASSVIPGSSRRYAMRAEPNEASTRRLQR